jgi:hypothetical protein
MKHYKQCTIQLLKDDAFTSIWIEVNDAVKDKIIDVDYKMFNIKGKAKVLIVYHGIIIEDKKKKKDKK